MTRKSEWTGMSPGSSDSARGSSFDHWDSQDFSASSLKGDRLQADEFIVDDKETASSAVAFVVHSSRKGIIHLCADVANLIKAKKRLELLVNELQEENARLKQNRHPGVPSEHSSRSTTPSPHSLEYLDSRYHNSSHRGRRKGSAARQSCVSPSLSTSTLTSPGEEVGPSYEEKKHGYFPRRYRRQLSSKRRDQQQFEQQAVINTEQQSGSGSLCGNTEERRLSDGSIQMTDTSNQHRITVEIHPSPLVKGEEDHAKQETKEIVETISVESVAVQCSLCEDLHKQLQENIEHVTREKSRIHEDYLQVQEEVKQLKLQIQRLEDDKQIREHCVVEFENEIRSKDAILGKCVSSVKDSPCQLPHLSGNSKPNPKSLNKITNGFTIHLEDRVMVKGERTGRVRYIGPLKHLNPTLVFVGVHLDSAAGRHDGYIHGHRYFQCPKDHGIFIPVKDVQTVLTSKSIKRPKTAKSPPFALGAQVYSQSKKTAPLPTPPESSETPPSCRPSSSHRLYVRRQSKGLVGRYSTEKQLK